MSKNIFVPIFVAATAIAFLDPFMYLMPSMVASLMLGLLMISATLYALIIYKEEARDEREISVRAYADRLAGLTGMLALVVVIVYQVLFVHHVDTVIVGILLLVIVAKSLAHAYAERYL